MGNESHVTRGIKKASRTNVVTHQGATVWKLESFLSRGALAVGNAAASCSCQTPRLIITDERSSFKQILNLRVNTIL
jgi:hypothetical protein